MRAAYVAVCLAVVAFFATSTVYGLDIQVAPQTLVLSSSGGQLTVHTDVPFVDTDRNGEMDGGVVLTVGGTVLDCNTFSDTVGNLVAQCSKDDAKEAIGEFDGKWTTVTVALDVYLFGESDSEDIAVKK